MSRWQSRVRAGGATCAFYDNPVSTMVDITHASASPPRLFPKTLARRQKSDVCSVGRFAPDCPIRYDLCRAKKKKRGESKRVRKKMELCPTMFETSELVG